MRLGRSTVILQYICIVALIYIGMSLTFQRNEFYRQHDRKVNTLNYTYRLQPNSVCSGNSGPDLLVMVITTSNSVSQRTAIRDTWGSIARRKIWPNKNLSMSVKIVFLIGLPSKADNNPKLDAEASFFGDVLSINMEESYGMQVTKKILTGLKWAGENCHKTKYVMKVDDDTFVDLPRVMEKLKSKQCQNAVCGHKILFPIIQRTGKYHIPYSQYPFCILPSYLFGYFYVMSMDVAERLSQISDYVPYIRMEDVFITGVLPRVIGVDVKGFETVFFDRFYQVNQCDFFHAKLHANVIDANEKIYLIWETFKNTTICNIM